MLNTSSLSDFYVVDIFSSIFTLLMISFDEQKLLILLCSAYQYFPLLVFICPVTCAGQ